MYKNTQIRILKFYLQIKITLTIIYYKFVGATILFSIANLAFKWSSKTVLDNLLTKRGQLYILSIKDYYQEF